MHAAAVEIDLRLPGCHSLKEKRAVLRPVIEGLRRRCSVSVAETADHDQWQRARIGFAAVASTPDHLDALLDRAERFVWSFPEIEVLASDRTFLVPDA